MLKGDKRKEVIETRNDETQETERRIELETAKTKINKKR